MQLILEVLRHHLLSFTRLNYHTNAYGVARSLMALCSLLVILGNTEDYFYQADLYGFVNSPWMVTNAYYWVPPGFYWLLNGLIALVMLAVIVGIYPQYTAVPHWYFTVCITVKTTVADGGDSTAAILTFLLLPIALTDNRKWHWQPPRPYPKAESWKNVVSGVAYWAICCQMAVVYFLSSLEKLILPEWYTGTAIYYWFLDPTYGASSYLWPLIEKLTANPYLVGVINYGTILFEFGLACTIFMSRRARLAWLGPALIFHVAIASFHGLFSFGFAMYGAIVLYLWPIERPFWGR
ncbi:MAG: hypothetical protein MUC97_18165 [Bernardetiaceae bacterium]|jgi:antimicrobial peptide system SdpB family protein|nr:hypothetical protein [Bernardetiaceae bacterium]